MWLDDISEIVHIGNMETKEIEMKKVTYRLGSNGLVFAPGIVEYCIHGYKTAGRFRKTKAAMVNIIASGWGIPEDVVVALLKRKLTYAVDGDVVEIYATA